MIYSLMDLVYLGLLSFAVGGCSSCEVVGCLVSWCFGVVACLRLLVCFVNSCV